MKYLVTFQDRIRTAIVEADSASDAAVKAYKNQKQKDKFLVIKVDLIPQK